MPTSGEAVYLDSSALVKLVVQERESEALADYLSGYPVQVSCALAIVELIRAIRQHGPLVVERAQHLLDEIGLIGLDDDLLHAAAVVDPITIRSFDAIHVAAAAQLGHNLQALVTYDFRMARAAEHLGLPIVSPEP